MLFGLSIAFPGEYCGSRVCLRQLNSTSCTQSQVKGIVQWSRKQSRGQNEIRIVAPLSLPDILELLDLLYHACLGSRKSSPYLWDLLRALRHSVGCFVGSSMDSETEIATLYRKSVMCLMEHLCSHLFSTPVLWSGRFAKPGAGRLRPCIESLEYQEETEKIPRHWGVRLLPLYLRHPMHLKAKQ